MLVITLTAISILILFQSVQAISVQADIPKTMQADEELELTLTAPEKGDYDVKIFFEYQETNFPSEILTPEGWKNSRYYIQDINFEEHSFNVRLQDLSSIPEALSICIRLRKADSTSTPQKQCSSISIEQSTSSTNSDDSEKENVSQLAPIVYNEVPSSTPKEIEKTTQSTSQIQSEPNSDPIYLSSQDKSTSEKETEYTSYGKSKILINCFIALAVLIGITIVVRSEIKHREI